LVHPTHVRHIARADPGHSTFHSPSGHRLVACESAVLHPDIRRGSAVLRRKTDILFLLIRFPLCSCAVGDRRDHPKDSTETAWCLITKHARLSALCARAAEKSASSADSGGSAIRAAAASARSARPQHLRDPRGRSICAIRAAAASALSKRPQHLRDPHGRNICDPCGRSICICIWVAGTTDAGSESIGCGHYAGTSCISVRFCIWALR
jgi:hypothetical protein